ncbi:luciferin 4-monooxygenase-like [Anthonomus grandis grandis]|uniref:luciferin 4-monooxygenase-like n=1 Tax=Anthonomus grandis grandis TaxID=2921223 RepID=UPI0021656E88|nr:luciferin 4-monooxygenase-like [Anthonomus grandis grandis]
MANIQEDDNFVIHGLKSEIPLVKLPVGKLIQNELLNVPAEAVALIDGFTQKQILYRELLQKSVDLAEALRRHGYEGQHNVFSISSENCLEFFIPVFASYFNGTIMAPLNHLYTEYELEYVLKISYPKVIFCSEDTLDNFIILKKKLGFIERIILLSRSDETPASNEYETIDEFSKNTLQGVNVDPRTFSPTLGDVNKMVALIMCSSGTTGLPKGVAISHLALCLRLTHSRDPRYQNTNSKFLLGIMPFFHGYGMHVTFSSLLNGHTVICMRQFDGEVYLRSIQDYKIDSIGIAPPLALFFINSPLVDQYDLSSLKDVFCGAAPLGRDVEEQLKKKLNIKSMRQGYGLTEMTLAVTVVTYGDSRPGSSGKVISFLSGKVRDPETGRSLGPNQVGELCWKGPYQMLYYYNNPEATKETFTSDGWLKSGDLGYYDQQGYFYIIDRLKELIKYKGYQVAPAELEALLLNHPKISDAGVVGLPDELVGERPVAFVVKRDADLTEDDVKKYVSDNLSPQKRLSGGVIFVDFIPKSQAGIKILRRELRNMLKEYKSSNFESKL